MFVLRDTSVKVSFGVIYLLVRCKKPNLFKYTYTIKTSLKDLYTTLRLVVGLSIKSLLNFQ